MNDRTEHTAPAFELASYDPVTADYPETVLYALATEGPAGALAAVVGELAFLECAEALDEHDAETVRHYAEAAARVVELAPLLAGVRVVDGAPWPGALDFEALRAALDGPLPGGVVWAAGTVAAALAVPGVTLAPETVAIIAAAVETAKRTVAVAVAYLARTMATFAKAAGALIAAALIAAPSKPTAAQHLVITGESGTEGPACPPWPLPAGFEADTWADDRMVALYRGGPVGLLADAVAKLAAGWQAPGGFYDDAAGLVTVAEALAVVLALAVVVDGAEVVAEGPEPWAAMGAEEAAEAWGVISDIDPAALAAWTAHKVAAALARGVTATARVALAGALAQARETAREVLAVVGEIRAAGKALAHAAPVPTARPRPRLLARRLQRKGAAHAAA